MLDNILGLETEAHQLVGGSNLYVPNVSIEDVVLPEAQKKKHGALLARTVHHVLDMQWCPTNDALRQYRPRVRTSRCSCERSAASLLGPLFAHV